MPQTFSYPTVAVVKRPATNTRGSYWLATYWRNGVKYSARESYDHGVTDGRPYVAVARAAIAKCESACEISAHWADVEPIIGYVDSANGGGYVLTYAPADVD